jgi:beta-galactosidase/beta-glucuronidase
MQRFEEDLNDGWRFLCGRSEQTGLPGGMDVALPHCWNQQDAFQEGVPYYRGWGSYELVFDGPAAHEAPDRTWHLVSEGFYGTGSLRLNQARSVAIDGAYLGFSIDVTKSIRFGESNHLQVQLTNRCPSTVLPGIAMPDFLLYGGLSGRLRLVGRSTVSIADDGVVTGDLGSDGQGLLQTYLTVGNTSGRRHSCQLNLQVIDPRSGEIVFAEAGDRFDCDPKESREVALEYGFDTIEPWSPASPQLYRVKIELLVDGEPCDEFVRQIGFRHLEWRSADGLYINGERIALRGINRHESMPGMGRALPDSLHRLDAETIHGMGLNLVRLSHYPQAPAFLAACDELGILVYPEIATWKSVRGYGRWLGNAETQMRRMVLRDSHHPSVILWGMGNESQSRRAYRRLREVARAADPAQRPVTYAENHLYRARRRHTLGIPDIWGVNYEFEAMGEGIESSRLQLGLITECANYPHTERGSWAHEQPQLDTILEALARSAEDPRVTGYTLWCYNDYATLRKERYRRFSGLVDAWRTPKLAASMLKVRHAESSMIDGAIIADGAAARLVVFSNCGPVRVEGLPTPVELSPEGGYASHSLGEGSWDLRLTAAADRSVSPMPLRATTTAPVQLKAMARRRDDLLLLDIGACDAAGRRCVTENGELTCKCSEGVIPFWRRGDDSVWLRGGLARMIGTPDLDDRMPARISLTYGELATEWRQ